MACKKRTFIILSANMPSRFTAHESNCTYVIYIVHTEQTDVNALVDIRIVCECIVQHVCYPQFLFSTFVTIFFFYIYLDLLAAVHLNSLFFLLP